MEEAKYLQVFKTITIWADMDLSDETWPNTHFCALFNEYKPISCALGVGWSLPRAKRHTIMEGRAYLVVWPWGSRRPHY